MLVLSVTTINNELDLNNLTDSKEGDIKFSMLHLNARSLVP